MKDLKRIHWILIAIAMMLLLTNPSRSSFASYLHQTGYGSIGRDFNGLIFSVYSERDYQGRQNGESVFHKTYYFGILGNFFKSPF